MLALLFAKVVTPLMETLPPFALIAPESRKHGGTAGRRAVASALWFVDMQQLGRGVSEVRLTVMLH